MAIKFDKLSAGMQLYDRHKYTCGNTNMRRIGEWRVTIVEVQENGAMVRWNGNLPRYWTRRQLEKLFTWSAYDECAVVTGDSFGWTKVRKLRKGEEKPV